MALRLNTSDGRNYRSYVINSSYTVYVVCCIDIYIYINVRVYIEGKATSSAVGNFYKVAEVTEYVRLLHHCTSSAAGSRVVLHFCV